MGAFFADIFRFMTGTSGFSAPVWLLITIALAFISAALAGLGRSVLDPVAMIAALRPRRGLRWMPLSILVGALAIMAPIISVVGSPVAVVVLFAEYAAALVGYAAVATVLGDRMVRAAGRDVPAWQAALVGVLVLRIIRAVPFVGGPVHAVFAWFGFACAMAFVWDKCLSWHRRRMPDDRQFAGAPVIEWHAEDAPA